MIGQQVEHPQFGRGQVLATYRNGYEWLVRFENGLRFRRPSAEFSAELLPTIPQPHHTPFIPPSPMPRDQLAARQLIEALRVGIAPAQHVSELTIGLAPEQASLRQALEQTQRDGGAVRAVVGEYGFGKSHLVELAAHEALQRNFLVAAISLDLQELPPHRGFAVYREAMTHLRYPDTDERGLSRLLTQSADSVIIPGQLRDLSPAQIDPLVLGLTMLSNISATRRRQTWMHWLAGGRKPRSLRGMPRGVKFPSIYKVGHNARQIAYLLTGVSTLARLNGYGGLCLLVDEAESYSLLYPYQRPKASTFFQAVIYAALRGQQNLLQAENFPQHRWRDYPIAYDQGQGLFFLFTVTRSDNRMPLQQWLTDEQIFHLDPQVTPQEVSQFLLQVLVYHAQAYAYESGERQKQVRRASAELLAYGLRNERLSMRQAVRLAIELFDLLYLYPDYDVAHLLDELRAHIR
ncbi:MAG: ATP-binding protein [Anaerolineae bacterium]|nr:ATP-binding protein [Anaerolineae bacterium]